MQATCSARRRLPVCRLRGKVTTRVFLLGWNFFKGLRAGSFPHKERVGSRTAQIQREALPTRFTRTPRVHTPGSLRVAGTREERRRVVTPASAGARPSAPAISAGRSAGTRTPSPAAQSAAKGDPPPIPPAASLRRQGAARFGDDRPKGRGREGSGRHPHLSP